MSELDVVSRCYATQNISRNCALRLELEAGVGFSCIRIGDIQVALHITLRKVLMSREAEDLRANCRNKLLEVFRSGQVNRRRRGVSGVKESADFACGDLTPSIDGATRVCLCDDAEFAAHDPILLEHIRVEIPVIRLIEVFDVGGVVSLLSPWESNDGSSVSSL